VTINARIRTMAAAGIALALAAGSAALSAQAGTASPATPGGAARAGGAATPQSKLTSGVYARFTTNQGTFTARLFEKDAPKTVANFIGLADGTKEWTDPKTGAKVKRPYYNNLTFHRVIGPSPDRPDGFMIQGGDPLGNGTGGPGYKFGDEFSPKLRHTKAGMLSMANSGPNSNGGQFFVTLVATPWLDDKHTIFGEVVEGMDVVKKIGNVKTDRNDKPLSPVIIQTVKIERVP
jgi:peptidyl-prolyl cis-trans isomerase A (cyclophilin A)